MKLLPMGDAAWRIELPPSADPAAVLAALRALPRVLDAVVTERHALLRFDPEAPPDDPRAAVAAAGRLPATERRHHVLRARYDGEDLGPVAASLGLTPEAVVALHAGRTYRVCLVGFLPGFAYLGPLDPALALPRRATPRPRVPPGAIGIAGERTGVYPFAAPGGWHLIGTTVGFTAFDPSRGAALALGDHVRFEVVDGG